MKTIYTTFIQEMKERPDAIACCGDDYTLTYNQLARQATHISRGLPRMETRRVGVILDHSWAMIACLLGILKRGSAYVPVEPFFPDERIDFMMKECDVDFVVTQRKYASRFKNVRCLCIEDLTGEEVSETDIATDESKPGDPAYILYTSGSTGLPKGVEVTNSNVCHYAHAFKTEFDISRGDVMLQYSVCSFDIFVEEVFATLLNGAALAIPTDKTRADMRALMTFVRKHQVTIISGFPYLLKEINKLERLPRTIRLLISGGDVLRQSYITELLKKNIPIYNTYGPSETTVCATYFRVNDSNASPDGTYPIGHPVSGARVVICDSKLRPVERGQRGEICIMGDGVSNGYIGDRQKENRAFVTMPDGGRLYRSGDMGAILDDGTILFYNRKDSQVMIMGRRVEACEVESVLCQCPEVEAGVVRPCTDAEGLSYLTAYVVPKRSIKLSLRSLRQRMRKFLPDYMIPEFFVTLASMPLTPNGKVNVNVLPVVMKN